MIVCYALCWPNDRRPLFYHDREKAEEDRKWFSKNYTRNSRGELRGDPFIVDLVPRENT